MRRWMFARQFGTIVWFSAACVMPTLTLARGASAQELQLLPPSVEVRIEEPKAEVSVVDQLLQKGFEFERSRRWSEALGHYEAAVKQHPDQANLKQRLELSRIHYDLARRYADTSFVKSVQGMTTGSALELYGEVLQKIQTHYVEAPNWSELLRRGAASLEVALEEPDFAARHLKNVTPEQVAAFRANLPRIMQARVLRTRTDAQQMVADIAYRAAQELGVSEPAIILEFTCGATGSLDPYSSFLTAAQLEDVFSQIEGNFVGLGVELKTVENALELVGIIEGSPADKGGMKVGEKIVAVDGRTTLEHSPDAVADMLKGPEGSFVTVTVIDRRNNTRRLKLMRQRVDVPSVDRIKIVDRDNGVGYFRITSFQKTTSRDVDAALWKLHREGMRFLIIDVRGNPGGLLTGSVEVADKFVNEGKIVSTRGRSAQEDFDYKAHAVGTWRVPLVVLIDGDSASASEIFAGAIHDHRRGTIVGTRSYGKGSVQGIFPLGVSKAGVRLTTAKFYSPSGQAISNHGVTPDVEVRSTAKPVVDDSGDLANAEPAIDSVLEAGVNIARNQLSKR